MKSIDRYLEEIEKYFENDLEITEESQLFKNVEDINKDINNISIKLKKIESNEENFKKSLINEYKLKNRIIREREKKIVGSLINIMDNIEEFLKEESLNKKKATLINKIIKREFENINLRKTSKVGELYNEEYHMCIGYEKDLDKEEGQILEVIRQGYIYRNNIVRQAEVIINNKKGEENV